MLKEQMNKFKNIFKSEDGNNKKKIENLVVFVIILIVTIIVINMVLKEDDAIENTQINNTKTLAKTDKESAQIVKEDDDELKENLEEILTKISGVGEVEVLITYSQTSQTVALYNEDSTQSDTEEEDSGGGNRKITEVSTKKEVIYQEVNGQKIPVTQSTIKPKIEGAVITATGAGNSEVKLKITQAVEAATGLATHKIQVFEMSK